MAGAYGLLSGLQRISFRGREPWGGSMDRCTKGVDLIFLADLSEPDAAAGRTGYDTDMGIWNERLLRLPEFLHEQQGWGTDGICKFRMGTEGYKEGDSGQSDKSRMHTDWTHSFPCSAASGKLCCRKNMKKKIHW